MSGRRHLSAASATSVDKILSFILTQFKCSMDCCCTAIHCCQEDEDQSTRELTGRERCTVMSLLSLLDESSVESRKERKELMNCLSVDIGASKKAEPPKEPLTTSTNSAARNAKQLTPLSVLVIGYAV